MYPYEDDLRMWNEGNGSRENVVMRIVDSRAAMHSKIGMREDKSFIDLLNELGMCWVPASGKNIAGGVERIISALEWRKDDEGKIVKTPELTFDRGCGNHIFAMDNYMGTDGQKGACKEAVDCLRYLFESGMTTVPKGRAWNVLVLDPAPERNWFMGWYRCEGEGWTVGDDNRTDGANMTNGGGRREVDGGRWMGEPMGIRVSMRGGRR